MEHKFRGSASGTLGTTSFHDAAVVIRARANTSDILQRLINGAFESLWVDHQSASIEIEGVGLANFTQITETWSREGLVGFARDFETYVSQGTDLVTLTVQSRVQDYNLYDELQLFPVDSFFVVGNQFVNISTSLGPLSMQLGSQRTGQFSALVVPEPASLAIGIFGIAAAYSVRSFKRPVR